jgi:hypothetical protein
MSRVATMFPTRLFDEQCCRHRSPANHAGATDCPSTTLNPSEALSTACQPQHESGTQRLGIDVEELVTKARIA